MRRPQALQLEGFPLRQQELVHLGQRRTESQAVFSAAAQPKVLLQRLSQEALVFQIQFHHLVPLQSL